MTQTFLELWLEAKLTFRGSRLGRARIRRGMPKRPLTRLEAHRAILAGLQPREVTQVIDVGPASWFYLQALREAFPTAEILGIELDPYTRTRDLYRRIDHADAQIARIARAAPEGPRIFYIPGNFMDPKWLNEIRPGALLVFFFPFVFSGTAQNWGLPGRLAQWSLQVERVLGLVRERGCSALIVHLAAEEVAETNRLLDGLGLDRPAKWVTLDVPDWGEGEVFATLIS